MKWRSSLVFLVVIDPLVFLFFCSCGGCLLTLLAFGGSLFFDLLLLLFRSSSCLLALLLALSGGLLFDLLLFLFSSCGTFLALLFAAFLGLFLGFNVLVGGQDDLTSILFIVITALSFATASALSVSLVHQEEGASLLL